MLKLAAVLLGYSIGGAARALAARTINLGDLKMEQRAQMKISSKHTPAGSYGNYPFGQT